MLTSRYMGSKILLFGGKQNSDSTLRNDAFLLDTSVGSFGTLTALTASSPPPARYLHSAAFLNFGPAQVKRSRALFSCELLLGLC